MLKRSISNGGIHELKRNFSVEVERACIFSILRRLWFDFGGRGCGIGRRVPVRAGIEMCEKHLIISKRVSIPIVVSLFVRSSIDL